MILIITSEYELTDAVALLGLLTPETLVGSNHATDILTCDILAVCHFATCALRPKWEC